MIEPLAGQRYVTVTERRTAVDLAAIVRDLVDRKYADAEKIVLVMDNLNTHKLASLNEAFEPAEARRLAERLEIHYLSNSDDQLYFGLLTDFPDAPQVELTGDADSLQGAIDGIRSLNEKHAASDHPRFFLFHRRRQWNLVR